MIGHTLPPIRFCFRRNLVKALKRIGKPGICECMQINGINAGANENPRLKVVLLNTTPFKQYNFFVRDPIGRLRAWIKCRKILEDWAQTSFGCACSHRLHNGMHWIGHEIYFCFVSLSSFFFSLLFFFSLIAIQKIGKLTCKVGSAQAFLGGKI